MIKPVFAVICSAVLFCSTISSAQSAERVVLRFGGSEYALDLGQVDRFLLTGESELPLPDFLKQNPLFRLAILQFLHQEIPIAPIKLGNRDQTMVNLGGEILLEQIAGFIQGDRPKDSLRNTLNASLRNGKFNPLRFIRSYPEPEIIINGDRLLELQRGIGGL